MQRNTGRYRFIEKLRAEVRVTALIQLLGVSKSGYYDWRNRQPSASSIEDDEFINGLAKHALGGLNT